MAVEVSITTSVAPSGTATGVSGNGSGTEETGSADANGACGLERRFAYVGSFAVALSLLF